MASTVLSSPSPFQTVTHPYEATDDPEVPYYIWPPFPQPPQGVVIVPFKNFVPAGILVSANKQRKITEADGDDDGDSDSDIDDEVDGLGIPTIGLGMSHLSIIPGEADTQLVKTNALRHKKQQRSMKKRLLAVEQVKKPVLTWWQKWEQEEQAWGGPKYTYNQNEDRADRLNVAVRTFRRGKALEPSIQSIWDKFLDYSGLRRHENVIPQKQKKKVSYQDDDYDEDFDEDAHDEFDDAEDRLINFLNDPDRSIKIFFSSYYREKGFSFEDARLRDGPLVIGFFLKYLLRERALPEYERDLRHALTSVETAISPDLVALVPFQRGVEDDFSQACVYCLGTMVTYHGLAGQTWMLTKEYNEMRAREAEEIQAAIAQKAKEQQQAKERMKVEMMTQGMATVSLGESDGWGNGTDGWGGPAGAGWDGSSWDAPEYIEPAEVAKWELERPTLASWITDSYALLRTEESPRLISKIIMPDPAAPSQLKKKYATLVLEPWKLPDKVKEHDYIQPPIMLAVADGEPEKAVMRMRGGGHRLEDPIEVIMTEEHAKKARVGLGINGVFVQAGRTKSADPEVNKTEATKETSTESPRSPTSSSKKKRGKSGPQADTFWFIQHARLVFPSFWIDM